MIVSVNGKPVTPEETVSYLIANTPVGSRVPLQIIRGGKRQTVTVTVGERPTEEAFRRSAATEPAANDTGGAASPIAPQRALGLVAGAADARAWSGREPARNARAAWSSPRSIRAAMRPIRASSAATLWSRSTTSW